MDERSAFAAKRITGMLEWLLAPIDPSRPPVVGLAISWHGRMMVLAWGFLVPLGIVVARLFKITPRQDWPRELDNKTWWRGHLAFQYAGGVATVLALGLILLRPELLRTAARTASSAGPSRASRRSQDAYEIGRDHRDCANRQKHEDEAAAQPRAIAFAHCPLSRFARRRPP